MAISGPPPKANRRRNNPDTFAADKVTLPTEAELAELKVMPEGEWLPEVQLWWRVWATSSQSTLWTATDWMRLRTLMVTVESYHRRPTPQKMAEIRQTEGLWGATYVDRMKARMKTTNDTGESASTAKKANLAVIADYKSKLAG